MPNKELCQQIFESFVPLLEQYKIDLELKIINSPNKIVHELKDKTLTINLASIDKSEYEIFIAYNIGQLILPLLRIETERLIIRRVTEADFESLFEIVSCKEVVEKDEGVVYKSLEQFSPLFKTYMSDKTRYTIELKDENRAIGIINFMPIDNRAVEAYDIGYAINKDYWRKGYAFEALSAFIEFSLKDLKVSLITARCLVGNEPSERLLKKLGFTFEGKIRKALYNEAQGASDANSYYVEVV